MTTGTIEGQPESANHYRPLVVAQAFTTYFELIDLAEERERIRALREQAQAGTSNDGLEEIAAKLAEANCDDPQKVLEDVLVQLTFTAHPTEARRKIIKSKLQSVADNLETLDEQLLTDKKQAQI
jgi:phosphoenolpyruvate carboxylase